MASCERSRTASAAAAVFVAFLLLLAGCATSSSSDDEVDDKDQGIADRSGDGRHLEAPAEDDGGDADAIPPTAQTAPSLPEPAEPEPKERYTVVVNEVAADEVLFALARDADMQIDIVGDIEGEITLNAIDQTLPRLLERIAAQVPIRYDLGDDYLKISEDEPFLKTYTVPYANVTRSTETEMDTTTEIEQSALDDGGGGDGSSSRTEMSSSSQNRFWQTLERNLGNLLDVEVTDDTDAGGSRHVIVNRESGYITVRATQAQHEEVQRFLDRVIESARRQVLIEATVVEVELSDRFQRGIDWSRIADGAQGFDFVQNVTGSNLGGALNMPDPDSPGQESLTVGFRDPDSGEGDLRATLNLLDTFGDVRVVSSPRITALNNQQSILKVVDNTVFFTVDVDSTTSDGVTERTFETQVNSVPVGLVMSVTPYIDGNDNVLLNVRPTVSRIVGFANDPNPDLAEANVINEIPEIQVREMESLLRVQSGQTAVLGGLMQDSIDETERGVPGLMELPLVGNLFSYVDEEVEKSELVIFLRPTVVSEGGLNGEYSDYRQYLDHDRLEDGDP